MVGVLRCRYGSACRVDRMAALWNRFRWVNAIRDRQSDTGGKKAFFCRLSATDGRRTFTCRVSITCFGPALHSLLATGKQQGKRGFDDPNPKSQKALRRRLDAYWRTVAISARTPTGTSFGRCEPPSPHARLVGT